MAEGDPEQAADELRRALEAGAPDELIVPHALAALAPLTAAAGRTRQASALADRAVEAAAPFELPGIQVMVLLRAAQTHTLCLARADEGADAAAAALQRTFAELLDRLHRAGIRQFVAETLELAAVEADRRGTTLDAVRYLAACDALRAARAEPSTRPTALTAIIETTRPTSETPWAIQYSPRSPPRPPPHPFTPSSPKRAGVCAQTQQDRTGSPTGAGGDDVPGAPTSSSRCPLSDRGPAEDLEY